MDLFKTPLKTQKTNLSPLSYSTPLGNIYFDLIVNNKNFRDFKPQKTISFQKTIVSLWDLENCCIEFLQTPFKPKIPSTMQVETCLAGIWRIKSLSKELLPVFRVTLNSNSSLELNGEPESGEGLVSITFENPKMKLSIGTEDEDYLNNRAFTKNWMPNHFAGKIFSSAIELLPNGIEVSLPCLKAQDCIQIQFIIAVASKKQHSDSCWFAVEQSSEYILREAGII